MRFFVYDQEGMATSLAHRLRLEGNDVLFYSQKEEGRAHLAGMVPLARDMREGFAHAWNGGYVICGDEQDVTRLRQNGARVYGGNSLTARLENDRVLQMQMAEQCGVRVSNWHAVKSADEAITYIKAHPDQWVLKQLGHAPKTWSFVGKQEDGRDTILQLEWMKQQPEFKRLGSCPFMLQEIVDGIEFGVSAWWIGQDWKRRDDGSVLVELDKEHKKELDGDLGRTTGEMGTVLRWCADTKLFEEMLAPLTPVLMERCSDVSLNINANCGIFLEDGEPRAYLYEWTPRQGYPASSLQEYLLDVDCGKFFADLIDRRQGGVEHKSGWGVVTVLGTGEFPSERHSHDGSFQDQPVRIPQCVYQWDAHLAPLYLRWDARAGVYRVADYYEYLLAVCHHGDDILAANARCVGDMKRVEVRAPRYRHDIGHKFAREELQQLIDWGYVSSEARSGNNETQLGGVGGVGADELAGVRPG